MRVYELELICCADYTGLINAMFTQSDIVDIKSGGPNIPNYIMLFYEYAKGSKDIYHFY